MGRLPTAEEDAAWTGHGCNGHGELSIVCGRRDERGRMLVTARYGSQSHIDRIDPLVQFNRSKLREAIISKFGFDDSAHEDIDARIVAACQAADAQPLALVEANVIRLRDIKAKPLAWLWDGYIPAGAITVLDSDPGEGK